MNINTTIDQIMHAEKRDMYFTDFTGTSIGTLPAKQLAQQRHFAWFDANNLNYKPAAISPLEGDTNIYAVYFTGTTDRRLAAYSVEFEDVTGKSLEPDVYQLHLLTYKNWLDNDGPQRFIDDVNNYTQQ